MGCKTSKQATSPSTNVHETATGIRATRLEQSRSTIIAACAEYSFFNPTHGGRIQVPPPGRSGPPLPEPEQMKHDLRTLHKRIVELDHWEADEAYRRLADRVRDRANEASAEQNDGFHLVWFRETVRGEMERFVVLGDLDTLAGVPTQPGSGAAGIESDEDGKV